MLYLVGGASRSGKSTIARRLLRQHGIPYFSIDILMMGFANGAPELGFDPDASEIARGEALWPILRAMCVNVLEEAATHPTYLIEGDALLPAYVAGLADEYPGQIRACFIGYTDAAPAEKLHAIRAVESDWMNSYVDEDVLGFIAQAAEFSRYLHKECATCGFPYFDSSAGMQAAIDGACRFLMS